MKFEVVVYCLIDERVSFDIAPLAIKFHEGENVSIDFRRNCFLIYLFSHDFIILKINISMRRSSKIYFAPSLLNKKFGILSMSINVPN